jgi:hypothetical protein
MLGSIRSVEYIGRFMQHLRLTLQTSKDLGFLVEAQFQIFLNSAVDDGELSRWVTGCDANSYSESRIFTNI